MKSQSEVNKIINLLIEEHGDAKCGLDYSSPYELLIATILSALCTDERVNMITKELFKVCSTPKECIELGREKLKEIIYMCGLSENKGNNIYISSKMLIDNYNSIVPNDISELIKLPGVGRKTANIVLSNIFGIPAIAVDRHVFKVSNRIGITCAKNVLNTEKQLMKAIPKDMWSLSHDLFTWHGRKICKSRKPMCAVCNIKKYCDYYQREESANE